MTPPRRVRVSTIRDVARVAGVSVATVSRALRGLDRVSEATRQRVLGVARDLDYVASPTATSLASGRTQVVGVVAPFLTRWFFSTALSAVEKTLRSVGHSVLIFDLEADSYSERLPMSQDMLWKRLDGVITLNVSMTKDEVALVDRLGLPLVAVGTPVPERPCVRIDDAGAVRTATEHLLDLGHEQIGYVGELGQHAALTLTPRQRLDAFRTTVTDRGVAIRPEWVRSSDWTAAAATVVAEALLSSPDRPTALVAASDEIALGVLAAGRRLGLSVPADLSVVGIDDHPFSAVFDLTTVRQDVRDQGERAAELLVGSLLRGEDLGEHSVLVPTELVVRASTAPAH